MRDARLEGTVALLDHTHGATIIHEVAPAIARVVRRTISVVGVTVPGCMLCNLRQATGIGETDGVGEELQDIGA